MLEKNVVYEAVITDYTAEGQGIAHIEGITVFIPNAIAGERVLVRIETVRKTWAAGKITELLEKSPHRVNRQCPVAKLCGGCDFWHMDYEEETRLKADRVKTCLNRLAGEHFEEIPILAAPALCGYRNKAQYPVASKKGRVYAGFFRAGTHEVVENSRCLILPEETDRVKDAVIDYANQYRVSAYDEAAHTGLLRHIYVRRGAVSGQVLVCLVANGRKLPHVPELVARLQKIPGFTTLVLSVNTKKGNAVLGEEFITRLYRRYPVRPQFPPVPPFLLSGESCPGTAVVSGCHPAGRHLQGGFGAGPLLRCGNHHPGHGECCRKGHGRGGRAPGH